MSRTIPDSGVPPAAVFFDVFVRLPDAGMHHQAISPTAVDGAAVIDGRGVTGRDPDLGIRNIDRCADGRPNPTRTPPCTAIKTALKATARTPAKSRGAQTKGSRPHTAQSQILPEDWHQSSLVRHHFQNGAKPRNTTPPASRHEEVFDTRVRVMCS